MGTSAVELLRAVATASTKRTSKLTRKLWRQQRAPPVFVRTSRLQDLVNRGRYAIRFDHFKTKLLKKWKRISRFLQA